MTKFQKVMKLRVVCSFAIALCVSLFSLFLAFSDQTHVTSANQALAKTNTSPKSKATSVPIPSHLQKHKVFGEMKLVPSECLYKIKDLNLRVRKVNGIVNLSDSLAWCGVLVYYIQSANTKIETLGILNFFLFNFVEKECATCKFQYEMGQAVRLAPFSTRDLKGPETRLIVSHLKCAYSESVNKDHKDAQKRTESKFWLDLNQQFAGSVEVDAVKICEAAYYVVLFLKNFPNYHSDQEKITNSLLMSIEYSHEPTCPTTCDGCRMYSAVLSKTMSHASKQTLFHLLCDFPPTKLHLAAFIVSAYKTTNSLWFIKVNYASYSINDAIVMYTGNWLTEIFDHNLPLFLEYDTLPLYKSFLVWIYENTLLDAFSKNRSNFHKSMNKLLTKSRKNLIREHKYNADYKDLDTWIVDNFLNQTLKGRYNETYRVYIGLVKNANA